MGHRIDELPVITTPSDSDKVVVEHDNLTSQITLARLIAAERNRLNQLESALQNIGASNGTFYHHFSQDSLLINQVDALEYSEVSTVFGDISSYGHMDATGVPENSSFYVEVRVAAAGYKVIEITQVGNGDRRWARSKNGGTWGDWVQLPSRTELTQLMKTGLFTKSSPATNISAGSPGNFSIPITVPSGYTLVGVIGYSGSGTSGFSYSDIYRSGDNIVIYYRNNNADARSITSFTVTVLFVKTEFISSV